MRLIELRLEAFGPFTAQILKFERDRLNLVYGPNEAGKSAALRAMLDLRFGIPARTQDNFLHSYKALCIAGVFLNPQNQPQGLLRRKAQKNSLFCFSPDTPQDLSPATFAEESALQGGLNREAFALMFGLDSARLREGGRELLRGDGELGSALFAASAGLQGVSPLLESLDSEARALFSPRSSKAVLAQAGKALKEHQRRLREAEIRPSAWQQLKRAHENACDVLQQCQQAIGQLRAEERALSELRTVAPLLLDHDRLQAELAKLAEIPALPPEAKEHRLTLQAQLAQAQQRSQEHQAERAQIRETLASLHIETSLLPHAEAIETLAHGLEGYLQGRIQAAQQALALNALEAELVQQQQRIDADATLANLLAAHPTAVEAQHLDETLSASRHTAERLHELKTRLSTEQAQLQEALTRAPALPDSAACQTLSQQLQAAQAMLALQDSQQQRETRLNQLQQTLQSGIPALGSYTLEQLAELRLLTEAALDSAEQRMTSQAQQQQQLQAEQQRLEQQKRTLEEQLHGLQAVGEIITAASLRASRQHRDTLWQQLRAHYPQATPTQLNDLEQAISVCDRQADLLRADAERAATFATTQARLSDLQSQHDSLLQTQQTLADEIERTHRQWREDLESQGLPPLAPAELRGWQQHCQALLSLAHEQQQLHNALREHQQILTAQHQALADALRDVGAIPLEAGLPALVEQARQMDKQLTAALATHQAQQAQAQRQQAEHAQREAQYQALCAEQRRLDEALAPWYRRLHLPAHASPAMLQARRTELAQLHSQQQTLHQLRLQQAQQHASLESYAQRVQSLADAVAEPLQDLADIEVMVQGLLPRLRQTQSHAQQQQSLQQQQRKLTLRLEQLATEQQGYQTQLNQLCEQAGVDSLHALPALEQQAAHKYACQHALQHVSEQLAQATQQPLEALRQALATHDLDSLKQRLDALQTELENREQALQAARDAQERTRQALDAIDTSDAAAQAREGIEAALAHYRHAAYPWMRLRLAHALLNQAIKQFRQRVQAPMLSRASAYFAQMTEGRYPRLFASEDASQPVLLAQRSDQTTLGVDGMSEGTRDQLYLALRLAALEQRDDPPPLVLDDVLITADDTRAACMLQALADFATQRQVILFTHHQHLCALAEKHLSAKQYRLLNLD